MSEEIKPINNSAPYIAARVVKYYGGGALIVVLHVVGLVFTPSQWLAVKLAERIFPGVGGEE